MNPSCAGKLEMLHASSSGRYIFILLNFERPEMHLHALEKLEMHLHALEKPEMHLHTLES
jgi:hypothetical protein